MFTLATLPICNRCAIQAIVTSRPFGTSATPGYCHDVPSGQCLGRSSGQTSRSLAKRLQSQPPHFYLVHGAATERGWSEAGRFIPAREPERWTPARHEPRLLVPGCAVPEAGAPIEAGSWPVTRSNRNTRPPRCVEGRPVGLSAWLVFIPQQLC